MQVGSSGAARRGRVHHLRARLVQPASCASSSFRVGASRAALNWGVRLQYPRAREHAGQQQAHEQRQLLGDVARVEPHPGEQSAQAEDDAERGERPSAPRPEC